jgi:hypothetical protein
MIHTNVIMKSVVRLGQWGAAWQGRGTDVSLILLYVSDVSKGCYVNHYFFGTIRAKIESTSPANLANFSTYITPRLRESTPRVGRTSCCSEILCCFYLISNLLLLSYGFLLAR